MEISEDNPDALYLRALALLKVGNRDAAIDVLEQTINKDAYFIQFLDSEPDLRVLQGDERFEALRSLVKDSP